MQSLRRRLALSAAVAAIMLAFWLTPLWRILSGSFQPLLVPLTGAVHQVALTWGDLLSGPRLAKENESLRQQLSALQSQTAELATLTQQNQELKQLNTVPTNPRFTSLGAEVIGRLQDESGTSYLINRGGRDGLAPGLAVVAGLADSNASSSTSSALLVGLVREVNQTSATFTLTTSSSSQVLVEVVNANHSRGVAAGEYNLGLELQFVPLGDKLTAGEQVVTSNLDSRVPPGLIIGAITAVEQHEGDFFVTATLAPPQPLERFRFLQVLKPSTP